MECKHCKKKIKENYKIQSATKNYFCVGETEIAMTQVSFDTSALCVDCFLKISSEFCVIYKKYFDLK